jgi:hypothetical protein
MRKKARISLSAVILGVSLMGAGALGVVSAGASAATACAAIENLPAAYAGATRGATSASLTAGINKVSTERSGVERVVAAGGTAAVTSGYRSIASILSAEIAALVRARTLTNEKATPAKINAQIAIANADNLKAGNSGGAMGQAFVNMGCLSQSLGTLGVSPAS